MAFEIQILTGAGVPIFQQIVDQTRLAVARGTLREGDQLPSVRAMAERLVVNPNTVARAYAELAREGLLDGQQGKGVFISKPRRQVYTKAERLRRLEPALDALIHQALSLNFSADDLREALDKKITQMNLPTGEKGGH
ncbi:MAG: GntR family transcriptional regulator [Candidatus Sumerlaeota bacterium]|nr:GntR family transcriptional regulator [Candidatus Sumerlaeota bacterium]